MIGIEKKLRPVSWISKKTWDKLKKKQKLYLLKRYGGKRSYSKQDFMDILLLDDNSSYWRFLKRLGEVLKKDIEKINKIDL